MNPMQSLSSKKSKLKQHRKAKSKKNNSLGENEASMAKAPSEFSFAATKTAVAQICQSVGIKRTQLCALETLTNVAVKYLQAIAKSAASFSNDSNRTHSNLFDIINAIHDLFLVQGFPTGSEMDKSKLLSSGALKDIMKFVQHSNEMPYPKLFQWKSFSHGSNPEPPTDSSVSTGGFDKSNLRGLHIPPWLPDFPKESLYKNQDQVLFKERKCGEKLWEHSVSMEAFNGNMTENGDILRSCVATSKEIKNASMELAKEREKVKFKIGGEEEKLVGLSENMMNVVRKGGKRVCWHQSKMRDCLVEENEDERNAFKRKK